MEFWIIWFVGVVLTIFTAGEIRDERSKIPEWGFLILVSLCIIIVGGIADAKWIGMLFTDVSDYGIGDILIGAIFIAFPLFLTYIVGYAIVGLYRFEKQKHQIYFVILFLVSVIGWTIPIVHYNRNIDYIEQTVAVQTQERQLLYFCNVPVQNISGNISGQAIFGSGGVKGTISTTDVLSYWYADENGDAYYDSANAENTLITFIGDSETPYVEIINYQNQSTTVNHNNGREKMEVKGEWCQYHFYLPEEIMQYSLE